MDVINDATWISSFIAQAVYLKPSSWQFYEASDKEVGSAMYSVHIQDLDTLLV